MFLDDFGMVWDGLGDVLGDVLGDDLGDDFGMVLSAFAKSALEHILLHKRRVNNFICLHTIQCTIDISRSMKSLRITVPYFNDIESTFGANGQAVNKVIRFGRCAIDHRCNYVIQKDIRNIFLVTTKGITSSTNVIMALPQGGRRITHEEEHSFR
jgi:hypothetical protein